jgi:hypothetical protein
MNFEEQVLFIAARGHLGFMPRCVLFTPDVDKPKPEFLLTYPTNNDEDRRNAVNDIYEEMKNEPPFQL